MGPTHVSLVGHPNVGKYTLFNRLLGKNTAIVSPIAGTTRYRNEGRGHIGEIQFILCDTGGFEDPSKTKKSPTELLAPHHGSSLVSAMHFQIRQAIRNSDLIIMVVDAKEGITQDDIYLIRWVQANRGKPMISDDIYKRCLEDIKEKSGLDDYWGMNGIVLVANKSEGKGDIFEWGDGDLSWGSFLQDCLTLGVGYPVPISAEHNQGMGDLHNVMLPYALANGYHETRKQEFLNMCNQTNFLPDLKSDKTSLMDRDQAMVLSIVGKPNAGKSTLVNAIIGEERCIAGPVPGLTRDAIQVE